MLLVGPLLAILATVLIGLSEPVAEKAILGAGLKLGKVTRSGSGDLRVVRQEPVAGAQVARNTPVDLVLGPARSAKDQSAAQQFPEQRVPNDSVGPSNSLERADGVSLERCRSLFSSGLRSVWAEVH